MNRLRFCIRALQALEDLDEGLEPTETSGLKEILAQVVVDGERVKR